MAGTSSFSSSISLFIVITRKNRTVLLSQLNQRRAARCRQGVHSALGFGGMAANPQFESSRVLSARVFDLRVRPLHSAKHYTRNLRNRQKKVLRLLIGIRSAFG
jgi:hypothetical protein